MKKLEVNETSLEIIIAGLESQRKYLERQVKTTKNTKTKYGASAMLERTIQLIQVCEETLNDKDE